MGQGWEINGSMGEEESGCFFFLTYDEVCTSSLELENLLSSVLNNFWQNYDYASFINLLDLNSKA